MFSCYNLFLFAQLIWAIPTCSLAILPRNTPSNVVASTWYAGWHSSNFTLQDVSWRKYTNIIYAFGCAL